MAKAWLVVLLLRKDKKLEREFIRRAKLKVPAKGKAALKVVTEVMAYVMGVKTESGRKLAWKRGRVIEFLHGQGIKIARIASEIQSRGGIEAVLKQAAKQKPRRDKGSTGRKANAKKRVAVIATSHHETDCDPADRDESEAAARSPAATRRNDGQVIMPMLIDLSDRDMLTELPAGSRVRLIATRVSKKDVKIEVNRIKKLKASIGKSNEDNEWE